MCSRVFGDTKVWGCPVTNGGSSLPSKAPSSSTRRPTMKTLELSNSMNPQYISLQLLLALNSSSYNALSCYGLNFLENLGSGETDENQKTPDESLTSFTKHLKVLIHSRKWLRLEFHRCLGVETLLWVPAEASYDADDVSEDCKDVAAEGLPGKSSLATLQGSRKGNTSEVEFLWLKFPRSSSATPFAYNEQRHSDFFVNLWNHWKVKQLNLSMDFTPEWTREFCRRQGSVLEELDISPECTWHRRSHTPVEATQRTETVAGASSNGDDNNGTNDGDTIENIDCWELFCRELRTNHPRLKSLEIRCKTRDDELAYLIDHAIAPAVVASDSPKPPSILPIEKLFFGKWCSCGEASLWALSRVLTSSSARRWKHLTLFRGLKLPSRAALANGLSMPTRPPEEDRRGLLEFFRSLQHATALTHLELGDYILDDTELRTMFESLVAASGRIQRLHMFSCAATSADVYERVLCGRGTNNEALTTEATKSSSCLIQNKLPSLRLLFLPEAASKALFEVLKYNTSIEWIGNHGRMKSHEYYLDLNRGGRRIFTALAADSDGRSEGGSYHRDVPSPSSALSSALWPRVLERASSDLRTDIGLRKDRYCGGKNRKYDVMYCLLRNRILLEL